MNLIHQLKYTAADSVPNARQEVLSISGNTNIEKKKHFLTKDYPQLATLYDPNYYTLWCIIKTKPAPVFTWELLDNIRAIQDTIAELKFAKPLLAPKYIVWLSDSQSVFNLGLDLNLLVELITKKDEKRLDEYLQKCIDVMYINLMKLDIYPIVTISLIRGKAYGGGFEAALSSDLVFVEEQSKCCFPEIHYNIFPSLGTLDCIVEKVNKNDFRDLILNGKHLSLPLLKDMGLFDDIVCKGNGCQVVYSFIKKTYSRHRVYASLYQKHFNKNLTNYEKLAFFKKQWMDVALHLKYSDLRRIEKLARAQLKINIDNS